MQRHHPQPDHQQHRRGGTFVEVMVGSVMMAILAIGAMTTIGTVSMSRNYMDHRMKANDLAQAMLSEVIQETYEDIEDPGGAIGTDAGESSPRSNFDDVDDFDGWDATPPVDRSGTAIPHYTGWRRQVFVKWVQPGFLLFSPTDTGLKHVTVRVTDPLGQEFEFRSLRNRLGAIEQLPVTDQTVVSWVGVNLQIGSDSAASVSGTNIVNHATD